MRCARAKHARAHTRSRTCRLTDGERGEGREGGRRGAVVRQSVSPSVRQSVSPSVRSFVRSFVGPLVESVFFVVVVVVVVVVVAFEGGGGGAGAD